MDIVLERILSLIPKGPDGKYVHGAKTKFAKKIGYNDGAIVAMWENGSSISYNKKLYQIADQYHVSVAWLKGETDDPTVEAERAKEKAHDQKIVGEDAQLAQFIAKFNRLSPQQKSAVLAVMEGYQPSQE